MKTAGNANGWPIIFEVDLEIGKGLVIFQAHIVNGMVFLDEVVLQNQGFVFRIGNYRLEVTYFVYQALQLE